MWQTLTYQLPIATLMSFMVQATGVKAYTAAKYYIYIYISGNTKGGSITVLLTSCLTGLDWSVLQIKTIIVSCHTADSKPVKQEVDGTVILPPLVFPVYTFVCTYIHAYI